MKLEVENKIKDRMKLEVENKIRIKNEVRSGK
jgi:hypothetical protein